MEVTLSTKFYGLQILRREKQRLGNEVVDTRKLGSKRAADKVLTKQRRECVERRGRRGEAGGRADISFP